METHRVMRWSLVALLAAVGVGLAWLSYRAAPVGAQDAGTATSTATSTPASLTPYDDCWGGTLSGDPLHCYVLGEAQRQGLLHVEGMYESLLGELYVYLRQSELVSEAVTEFFKAKAHEYMGSHPEIVRQGKGHVDKWCSPPTASQPGSGYRDCVVDRTFLDRYALPMPLYVIRPWTSGYLYVYLGEGGAAGRRMEPGWASWSQLWPAVEVVGGVGGASGASGASGGGYDVSDVDVTNFPELDCDKEYDNAPLAIWQSCHAWQDYYSRGIAGVRNPVGTSTSYVHTKPPIPDDEAGLEALKERLVPGYKGHGVNIVLIPVKYDFGELWRWSVVLDRFAVSRGNTVGIIWADVDENTTRYEGEEAFPLVGLGPGESPSEMRDTIMVGALDMQRVVDALPSLLPQLGIPVDAVGVVHHYARTPQGPAVFAVDRVNVASRSELVVEVEAIELSPAGDAGVSEWLRAGVFGGLSLVSLGASVMMVIGSVARRGGGTREGLV